MLIDWMRVLRFGAWFGFCEASENRANDLFSQDDHACKDVNSVRGEAVSACFADTFDQVLSAQFAQVVGGIPAGIGLRGLLPVLRDLLTEFFCREAGWIGGQSQDGFSHRPHTRLLQVHARQTLFPSDRKSVV